MKRDIRWWQSVLVGLFLPLILAFALLALGVFLVTRAILLLAIWTTWCRRGKDILFVCSESPVWNDYIGERILPHLGERAVILNWSQRRQWGPSLARMAFFHFGGRRGFNPLAVVFRPLRPTRDFRFWQPFKDFKHGHPESLQRMQEEFFALTGIRGT